MQVKSRGVPLKKDRLSRNSQYSRTLEGISVASRPFEPLIRPREQKIGLVSSFLIWTSWASSSHWVISYLPYPPVHLLMDISKIYEQLEVIKVLWCDRSTLFSDTRSATIWKELLSKQYSAWGAMSIASRPYEPFIRPQEQKFGLSSSFLIQRSWSPSSHVHTGHSQTCWTESWDGHSSCTHTHDSVGIWNGAWSTAGHPHLRSRHLNCLPCLTHSLNHSFTCRTVTWDKATKQLYVFPFFYC